MRASPPKLPEDYERTLRCANAALYAVTVVAVAVCVAVAWGMKGEAWSVWQRVAAVGGGVLAALWGGYYALYRVRVDAVGVAVGALHMRRYEWQRLRGVRVSESDLMGVAQCAIFLSFSPGGEVEISSSLMNLEEVQKMLAEWRSSGLCEGDSSEESQGQTH